MTQPYALTITGPKDKIFDLADSLGFDGPFTALSVSVFEKDDDLFYVQALYETQTDAQAAQNTQNITAECVVEIEQLPDEDWVSLSQSGLEPVTAGRFLLFGAHDADNIAPTDGQIPIQVDAGLAFGTGHHGTTAGCLEIFDALLTQGHTPKAILDLGCGAGTLAIAAAKALDQMVLATDIDSDATHVTLENAKINNVAQHIKAQTVNGFSDHLFDGCEFNLIFANILAKPLMGLAPEIAAHLSPNGYVILSGILREQRDVVAKSFAQHNIQISMDCPIGEWVSLLGQKT